MNYSREQLTQFTRKVFMACGMPEPQAIQAAEALLAADMRGIDSHGVARLSGYVRLADAGRANLNAQPKIVHETPSTATLDANRGLGLISASVAMDIAIEKAKVSGTGWVAIRNSNHFGIAAYHAMKALPHQMIGISMTNASPLVAPTHSRERMLGTNPVCFAFPSNQEKPFVLDMATSFAANGKLEIAQRKGMQIPDGWVQTANGEASNDPDELKKGGALMPLGGHKGYGLGAAVDILSAVLSGANYGPWVPPFVAFLQPLDNQPGEGIGHFVGAMRVDAFRPVEDYLKNMDHWIGRFRQAQRIDENIPVLIPGEPEFLCERERSAHGIPLNELVIADLQQLGKRFGIAL